MRSGKLGVFVCFVFLSLGSVALAQDDPLALKEWSVPFEQIRATVGETGPTRIAERSLHPSVNTVPSAASHFITMVPCRILDTRNPGGPFGGPIMSQGETRSYNVPAGPCSGIPSNASAYSLNFSVTQTAAAGYMTAWPTGSTQPNAATMTWFAASQTLTTAAIVPAGTTSSISIFAGASTHIILDINGYFVEGVVTNLNPGTGMLGGGTGNVTLGLAPGGVTSTQIAGNTITATNIGPGQVVKNVNSATDSVSIVGTGAATVST